MINLQKGQGALEYLLLISGAIIIAVMVVFLLVGMNQSSKQGVHDNATTSTEIISQTLLAPVLDSIICVDSDHATINYQLQKSERYTAAAGGTLYIIVDGVIGSDNPSGTPPVMISTSGASVSVIGICSPGVNHEAYLQATDSTGNFVNSNALIIYTD